MNVMPLIALLAAFVLQLILCPVGIPMLHRLKIGQYIRELGPEAHKKKTGTPTMGGIMILLSFLAASLIAAPLDKRVFSVLLLVFMLGIVGFLDDFLKLRHKQNEGLKVWQKWILQCLTVGIFLFITKDQPVTVRVPFTEIRWNLGAWYYVIMFLYILGFTNGTNFTDGLDGLLSGVTVVIAVFFAFILGMWVSLERPPLRTMGETRLWYSFFLPVAGIIVYSRWRYKWILSFSTLLSFVFICVNLFKPEIHSKNLMPALQNPWFAPHVIVYMFSYALLGAATVMAIWMLVRKDKTTQKEINLTDNLVYVGQAFLTFGMLFGALWAKEAWGTYWAWDPKETCAAATWLCYLVYLHFRKAKPAEWQISCIILLVSFVCLQICWWGINYLPSAHGGLSVHTY